MAIEGIYLPDSGNTVPITGKDPSQLTMNDFLNLLVAQMTNQDMLNPMEDTEFIAQMAQFSSLQGIQTIQEYQLSAYAASYAGKYVTIAETNDLGVLETISGKVDAITFYDGQPKVQVNGKTYDLFKVMEVSDTATAGSLAEAAQYIGKDVTVVTKNEFDETVELSGTVTGVTITGNVPQIIIDGKEYPVTSVKKVNTVVEEEDEDNNEPGTTPETAAYNPASAPKARTANVVSAADRELGEHVARKLELGFSNDPADYSSEEIMAYARVIASPRTGASVRTPAEIAKLIVDSGSMK